MFGSVGMGHRYSLTDEDSANWDWCKCIVSVFKVQPTLLNVQILVVNCRNVNRDGVE